MSHAEEADSSSRKPLRQRAEEHLRLSPDDVSAMSPDQVQRLVHELQVHQIELQLQNEELLRTQMELGEVRDRYFDLFELAPVGYITVGPDCRVQHCNLSAAAMLGKDRSKVENSALASFVVREDRDSCFLALRESLEDGRRRTWECAIARPPGEKRYAQLAIAPLDEQMPAAGCRITLTDVTAQQQAEAALRELNDNLESAVANQTAELRSITDAAHEAILLMDPHGAIIYWNVAAERIFGYSAEEVLGKNLHDLLAPERYHADFRAAFAEFVRTGRGKAVGRTLELFARRRDGREIDVSLSLSAVSLRGAWHAVGILSDITERKKLEHNLRAAMLESAAANVAKGEFLANMSHEIRTPMNGVIGMTGLLLDTPLNAEQRRYAETIRTSGESLLALVNDILDFSKIEAGKLELELMEFDLRNLLQSFSAPLAMRARSKGIEFVCAIEPDVPSQVCGDPSRLRQILINLAGNAVKFTEQGRVSVQASLISETATAFVVRFSIRDTGIGIPLEHQEMLFQKFTQADASTTRRYGGTGLGLAISKKLTGLMAGEIGVNSAAGAGSEFWFTVPLGKPAQSKPLTLTDAKPARSASPTGRSLPAVLRQGARILVAEDNVVNQEVALGILHKLGLQADAVANGLEAVEVLRTQSYDLVLMDVQMPEMDGFEATRIIRDPQSPVLDHQIPVIAMTAHAMLGDREHCLQTGMNDYIAKPVSPYALIEALNTWLPPEKSSP
jgi:PAS domain S-box-containing protein